jgi:glyoxylase-like metal-dependent hydrolase (beta-lactamase superfamily II)
LAGRRITAHALTHAHFDHAGSAAWLCRTFDVPLWCGAGDAEAMTTGHVATHGSAWLNRAQQTLLPVAAHPVRRALQEGDLVGGFEVLEVLEAPGHTDGSLAFWRQRDRVLVCGDALANFGLHPDRPRLVLPPAKLSTNREQNRDSVRRLIELRPRLACFGHGFAIDDPGRFTAVANRLLEGHPMRPPN